MIMYKPNIFNGIFLPEKQFDEQFNEENCIKFPVMWPNIWIMWQPSIKTSRKKY